MLKPAAPRPRPRPAHAPRIHSADQPPFPYQTPALLGLVALVFAGYGAKEIKEALEDGTSTRDGVEALMLALLPLVVLVLVIWNMNKRGRIG